LSKQTFNKFNVNRNLNVNRNFQNTDNLLLGRDRFLEFDVVTDLGVIINNKLKFSQHITSIISKAKKTNILDF